MKKPGVTLAASVLVVFFVACVGSPSIQEAPPVENTIGSGESAPEAVSTAPLPQAAPQLRETGQPGILENADGASVQAASGAVFPSEIGILRLSGITVFDETGTDVGANYIDGNGGPIHVTQYVYPHSQNGARVGLEDLFRQTASAILQFYDGAETLRAEPLTLWDKPAYIAIFRMPSSSFDDAADDASAPLLSYLIMTEEGAWFVKYRFTYPESMNESYGSLIVEFLENSAWPAEDTRTNGNGGM